VWVALTAALLALNYFVASMTTHTPARVRVPYSPLFLKEVAVRNVNEITSTGTAIQGTFKRPRRFNGSKPTTRFKTEVPTFADTDELSRALARAGVVVNAKPLQRAMPWWENLLLNVGPTVLFLVLLVLLARRGASAQALLGSARGHRPA
jgi:cell division protease FtsH